MSDSVIAHLRRKVIVASLAAVFASLAALIFAINYTHYLQTDAGLRAAMDEMASFLQDKDMVQLDGPADQKDKAKVKVEVEGNQEKSLKELPEAGQEGLGLAIHGGGGRRSARTQYANRFFCVMVASDGSMTVREKGSSVLTNDDATDLAQSVLDSGKLDGYLDDYKFVVEKIGETDQTRILFLDCTTELQSLGQLLGVSLAVGGCALAIAALFVVRFSGLAVRPLEESSRKQKQFVADAGHELKTPLSVIATNMDILEVDLIDRPEEQEWIDSTNRQVRNMQRLVNDLITLSKMEEGAADLVFVEVSLTDVAYECVLTFKQLASAQGKELVASIDEDVRVMGDEPAIRQLMTILIDNAIKYAIGPTVWVEVRREDKNAVFLTRNEWEHNVDAREFSTLFDRFVRGDQSRDRSGGSAGYGLGLSIARAIAQKCRAKLDASQDADGRIVFRLVFRT
ncbi:MAG: HAMP domain-containing sensor histidine kinase [Coriobacteriales bacterium]|nr:HAMP domain-containing sensor histidine kinase [Coriobacteriales bacterium]